MTDIEHVTQVEDLGDETFDAACTCGWEATGFEDYDDADVAGDEHVANPDPS